MAKDTIKSVVVDDVDMMRATLKKVLDGFPNIEIGTNPMISVSSGIGEVIHVNPKSNNTIDTKLMYIREKFIKQ